MDALELRRQRIIAKAQLDLLTQQLGHGTATTDEVAKQQAILNALQGVNVAETSINLAGVAKVYYDEPDDMEEKFVPATIPLDDPGLLEILAEMREIDYEKNRLSNQLANADRAENQSQLVQAIKAKREEWLHKSEEKYYYLKHGKRYDYAQADTEAEPENGIDTHFLESLNGKDKFDLSKMERNIMPRISDYKKGIERSKTDVKKAHYEKMLSKAQIELSIVRERLNK